ncbi:type II toxin-antitoxin system RelE/ParE family toxin [Propionimicrobium sp. PCR01-08-3]|uniref:type II toxin-antitoxin system RelE/ParE family toxin n=1 Tax=Propionimicrobium sp. PCR01-08-3 TaxID=3052086 RepID=UPI00255CA722|nr:type II toxin-antitoxin system RelE/ParE family toxin [Propionimicrobium sp. PCR01-08-3]WIY83526.1 type II toxin-antitoxin system RelE/ParE family toxin [Propionimicrobium sp. PCR01-08-3]
MRRIVYSPRAREQLTDLYTWIADRSGFPDRAEGYVSAILDYCDGLTKFPFVGVARDDLRPGLRTIGFRRRVVIAFAVTDDTVEILGIYYGGRDYETLIAGTRY